MPHCLDFAWVGGASKAKINRGFLMDEYGCDFDWTPEPRKLVTAVLAHPIHGRLVEKVMWMVSSVICFKECFYTLSWQAGDVAYYQPVHLEAETCCGAH